MGGAAQEMIRRGWALAAVFLTTACVSYAASPSPERVRLPELEGPYTLPSEMCGGYFIVDGWLNGTGPWPLLLDSGAGRTVLDPTVREAAGIRWRADSLRIGEFEAFRFGAGELEMTALSSALGREIVGILGHPVFAGVLMTWDPKNRAILLERGELDRGMDGVFPARDDSRPWVGSVIGGDTLWVLIDTGSSRGLTLRNPERLDYLSPLTPTGARERFDGTHLVTSGRLATDARIGPLVVATPVVNNSVSVDLVGQEILEYARITFDQRNDLIRFERVNGDPSMLIPSPPVRSSGYAVRPGPSGAEVIHLFDGLAPEGIEVGDVIVSVNGVRWTERGCPGARPSDGDTPPTVEIQRGDSIFIRTIPVHILHGPPGGDRF